MSLAAGAIDSFPGPTVVVFDENPLDITCVTSGRPNPGLMFSIDVGSETITTDELSSTMGGCTNETYTNSQSLQWGGNESLRRTANGTYTNCSSANEYGGDAKDSILIVQCKFVYY